MGLRGAGMRPAGKALGVDYGERRTGVAVSDEAGIIAFPRETIASERPEQVAAAVARMAAAEGAAEIVLGLPLNMNGTEGPRVARTRAFAEELKKRTAAPVTFWDERLSTKTAEAVLIEAGTRRERRREVVDKLAAQQILQNYLDAQGGFAEPDWADDGAWEEEP